VGKLLVSYTAKVDSNSEPSVLVEPNIVDKPEPEVVNEPEPKPEVVDELVPLQEEFFLPPIEVKELLIDTLVKLIVKPTMELVSSLTTISLKLSDIYDPL